MSSNAGEKRTRELSKKPAWIAVPAGGLKLKFKTISPKSYRYLHSHQSELREAFQRADTDGNGSLEPGEFRHVINSLAGSELDELSFILTMMKADKDGGGSIDYLEFIEFLEDQDVTKAHIIKFLNQEKLKLQKMFKEMDSDGNGTLSCSEFANVLKKMWGKEVDPLIVAMVWADVDRDQNGAVDIDEFLRFMEQKDNHPLSPKNTKKAKVEEPDPPPPRRSN